MLVIRKCTMEAKLKSIVFCEASFLNKLDKNYEGKSIKSEIKYKKIAKANCCF